MQVIADFFVDSLVVPTYFYLAAYGIVWIIAFVLARLFMNQNQNQVERATRRAWGIAIVIHILGGTFLIIWIFSRAVHRVPEWWYIPIYLILYVLIVIVDVCFLISLYSQRTKKDIPDVVSQPQGKSRNPKKR